MMVVVENNNNNCYYYYKDVFILALVIRHVNPILSEPQTSVARLASPRLITYLLIGTNFGGKCIEYKIRVLTFSTT